MADAFTWGAGGEAETSSSRARRRLAEALVREGSSGAPIQSWSQGLNRIAQALVGGAQLGEEDARDLRQEQQTNALMAAHPAFAGMGGAAQPMAAQPAVAPGVAKVAAALTGSPSKEEVRVYGPEDWNKPNPMDPPSGADRDMAIRTIVAEAGSQPFEGQTGVAATFRNRAIDGSYGGDTLPGVIQKPYAYEPWNTQGGRDRMASIAPTDPRYVSAGKALDAAYFGTDPTDGATHFVAPKAQAALGRPMPSWATGESTTIGDHTFYSPDGAKTAVAAIPANAQPTQGYAVPGGQPAPAGPQMPPAVAEWVQRAIRNPATRGAAVQVLGQYTKPRESYTQETDAKGNVWNINTQTGQRTVALQGDKEEAGRPMTAQERASYGIPEGTPVMMTAKGPKGIGGGGTTVNNNMGGGSDKQIFEEMVERSKAARTTAAGLTSIREARQAIEGGAITGFKADDRLSLQKAAKYFGVPLSEANKIENSEVFKAAIAPQVASVLRATVGSANISDSDRKFAERAAGGTLDLDEASIKRLLDIMERSSTSHLQQHQETLDALYPDPEKHKRERALFGIKVTAGGKASGATKSGLTWSAE